MISPRDTVIQRIEPALLLECLGPRTQQQIGKLLAGDEVHMLVVFTCAEETRYEYMEVGPTRRVHRLDEALASAPEGVFARYLVPSATCPSRVLPAGLTCAHSIPYAMSRLSPMGHVVVKAPAKTPESAPVPAEPLKPAKVSATKPTATSRRESSEEPAVVMSVASRAETPTEVSAPAPLKAPVTPESVLSEDNPADTLRRALHGVLAAITDREAALSVREDGVGGRLGVLESREKEVVDRLAALDAREAALAASESAFAERESAFETAETDFKTRRNSVAFREKNLSAREQEAESRLLDINAREGALVNREKEFLAREAALSAREKALATQEAAIRAETAALIRSLESIATARTGGSVGAK